MMGPEPVEASSHWTKFFLSVTYHEFIQTLSLKERPTMGPFFCQEYFMSNEPDKIIYSMIRVSKRRWAA